MKKIEFNFEETKTIYPLSVFLLSAIQKVFGPSSLDDINLVEYILAKYPPSRPPSLLSGYYLLHESAVWTKQSRLEHQPICQKEGIYKGNGTGKILPSFRMELLKNSKNHVHVRITAKLFANYRYWEEEKK